jgi:hypothetical protein
MLAKLLIRSTKTPTPVGRALPKIQSRSVVTTSSGGIVSEPEKQSGGLLYVTLTVTAGLIIGAAFSKNMASFLEENELFVPADDDDDD